MKSIRLFLHGVGFTARWAVSSFLRWVIAGRTPTRLSNLSYTSFVLSMLLLAGCALPGVYSAMDEKQIAAMAQIKDAGVICVQGSGPPLSGQGSFVFASVDKGVYAVVEVTKDCAVKIDNSFRK